MFDKYGYRIELGDAVCYVLGLSEVGIAVRGYEGFYPFLSDYSISPYPITLQDSDLLVLNYGSLPVEMLKSFAAYKLEFFE